MAKQVIIIKEPMPHRKALLTCESAIVLKSIYLLRVTILG